MPLPKSGMNHLLGSMLSGIDFKGLVSQIENLPQVKQVREEIPKVIERLRALEDQFDRVEGKLDGIIIRLDGNAIRLDTLLQQTAGQWTAGETPQLHSQLLLGVVNDGGNNG
jgi:hypothetical protein